MGTKADQAETTESSTSAKSERSAGAKRSKKRRKGRRPARAQARSSRRRSPSSSRRNLIIFVGIAVLLAAGFGFVGNSTRSHGPNNQPKWKKGQIVTVPITLKTTDYKQLACALDKPISGLHCRNETRNKIHSLAAGDKGNSRKNGKLLQPYTTTDRIQVLAAGLWMTAPLKKKLDKENWKLPSTRFTATCRLKIEGKASGSVQWQQGSTWYDAKGWYVGQIESCTL